MVTRIFTAIVGIPVFLGALYYGGFYLLTLTTLLVVLGLLEIGRFLAHPFWDFLYLSGLSLLWISYTSSDSAVLLGWLTLSLIYLLIRSTFSNNKPLASAGNLLAVFYVAGLYSFLWIVRVEQGFLWVFFALIITWLTDTGAYFVGRSFGRHKLAPVISPKKTWEGGIGGLVFAVLGAITFAFTSDLGSVWFMVPLAIFLSLIGQIGDLSESAMKRERGLKDSGTILPGHGGILDRFDSLVFILPFLHMLLKIT